MSRRAAVAATAALALCLLSAPAVTAAAPTATPAATTAAAAGTVETVFNHPRPDGAETYEIPAKIASLIDQAATGTDLYLSIYGLSRPEAGSGAPDIVQKLLDAQNNRNVKLHIVGEQFNPWGDASMRELQSAIAAKGNGGDFTFCQNACLGNATGDASAINHNKFLIVDQLTDGTRDVVAQTSANFAPGQGGELNNLVVLNGDASLRASYIEAYLEQVRYAGNAGVHITHSPSTDMPLSGNGLQTVLSPRDPAADLAAYGNEDVAGSFIDKVVCSPTLSTDRIRISGAGLDRRSLRPGLWTALERAKNAGCTVEMNGQADSSGVDEMTALDIPLYGSRAGGCRYTTQGCGRGMVHSKYILMEWVAGGVTHKEVLTGSHNWTKGSLQHNDETILRISDDATAYQAFLDNFNKVYQGMVDIDATAYGSAPDVDHYQRVNVSGDGDQHYSAMAAGGTTTPYLAVVYEQGDRHDPADTELGTDVYIRMYRDGVPLWTEKKLSSSGTGSTWSHQKPDVGIDNNGNAVVVWTEDPDGNKVGNIAVRRITPDGTVSTLPMPYANGNGDQLRPTVAVTGSGGYAVAWEDADEDGTDANIHVSGYNGNGAANYENIPVSVINTGVTTGSNRRPDLAVDSNGSASVVWEEDADGNGATNIGLVELNSGGVESIPRKVANTVGAGQQTKPAVAENASGQIVATWMSDDSGTSRAYYRSFDTSGAAAVADRYVTPAPGAGDPPLGPQYDPDVAITSSGDYVITWKETFWNERRQAWTFDDVWGRGFNADGTTAGRFPAYRLNVVTGGGQGGPAVAITPSGRLSFTYSDDYDQNDFNEVRLRDGFANK